MSIERWNPSTTTTQLEQRLLARMGRHRKLFAFLRTHRREILDDELLDKLAEMYRQTGAGKAPVCPGLMAMAALLQGYDKVSDAEAVERTVVDLRWQMVLDVLRAEKPAFSQGAFQDFRHKMIAHDIDRLLLERTAKLAKETGAFDSRKLPQSLRVAIDSMPLEGAGRVEDTINLLAHAGRKVAACAARLLDCDIDQLCAQAGAPLLTASSVKAALDLKWSDEDDKHDAVTQLSLQLVALERWLNERLPASVAEPPLKTHIETIHQIIDQDLEPDPEGGGGAKIAHGVAPDRRVSVEDKEMRHGRKSKSKRFDGYKRHIAVDMDTALILACALAPANQPEGLAATDLAADLKHCGLSPDSLFIDRAYVNAPIVDAVVAKKKGPVVCRPWQATNRGYFPKDLFQIDLRSRTITCPEGHSEAFTLGATVEFDPDICEPCPSRSRCTPARTGHGRTISVASNEPLQKKLRKILDTRAGRAQLRERVVVEHILAHAGYRQGRRARYLGVRHNLWDWRRAATITNLQTIHRGVTMADLTEQRMAA